MGEAQRTYLPAAGHDWALPLYDPFVKLLGGDSARKALIEQADLRRDYKVLDVGCGTGTLAVIIKRLYPDIEIIGLDPDPKALARAERKARRCGVPIQFDRGFSDELPYPDATFDRVFSSFMYHHIRAEDKEKTLREVCRVLRPGGSFHLLDFAGPESGRQSFLGSSDSCQQAFAGQLRKPHPQPSSARRFPRPAQDCPAFPALRQYRLLFRFPSRRVIRAENQMHSMKRPSKLSFAKVFPGTLFGNGLSPLSWGS